MNFAALNLGVREARLPARQIRALAKASPVPMISANLLDAASGQPLCAPFRIVERDGYRVGFVGVVDSANNEEAAGEGITVEPMETALSKLLPALRGQTDLLVLLAFADEAKLGELAKRFYEFDLILGGNVRQPSQHLLRENRSVILYTTNESKALGVLKAVIAGPSRLTSPEFDIVLMSADIPQAESILQESVAYRDEIRRTRLNVDDPDRARDDQVPGVRESSRYLGSKACAACHFAEYVVWLKSGHAHAFESLAQRHSDADPACIGCHAVGFGSATGYRRESNDKQFTGVGCESCHGPGSEHVAQRESGQARFKFRPLGASDCTKCHHGEFSRPFEWNDFWPAIEHKKTPTASKPAVL